MRALNKFEDGWVTRSYMFYKTQRHQMHKEPIEKADCPTRFCTNIFESVPKWSNTNLTTPGSQNTEINEISIEKLYDYIGLEITTSGTGHNCLQIYWGPKTFYGQEDFPKILRRDRFLKLLAIIPIYPGYGLEEAVLDTFLHSPAMTEHFLKIIASGSVTVDVYFLYEKKYLVKGKDSCELREFETSEF